MTFVGIPVWALVLCACAMAPFIVQLWVQNAAKQAEKRTTELLAAVDPTLPALVAAEQRRRARSRRGDGGDSAAGEGAAASTDDDVRNS